MTDDRSADRDPATAGRSVDPVPDGGRAPGSPISLQTFGGPAGQIAVMQRTLVDEKRWIGQQRFLHALNYCMLLPGPEAQQLAIYIGWLLNGTRGGLVAGTLFVLPGVVALLALSAIYVAFGDTTVVAALFAGLAPAVLAIVAQAVVRVGKPRAAPARPWSRSRSPRSSRWRSSACRSRSSSPPPALAGWAAGPLAARRRCRRRPRAEAADDGPPPLISDDALHTEPPVAAPHRCGSCSSACCVWWRPRSLAVALLTGTGSVFTQQGLFFSGAAVVTFGGAYAVLAYVAQQAVEVYGWLAPGEMVRGLALAETTPGPLIMVVQFVGVPRRLPRPRRPRPLGRRGARLAAGHLGDLRAVLPVRLPRRPVRRAAARQPGAVRRAHRHHRRRRRRHRQPRRLLRRAHPVRRDPAPSTGGRCTLELPDLGTLRPGRAGASPPSPRVLLFRLQAGRCCAPSASAPLLGLAAGLAGLPVA